MSFRLIFMGTPEFSVPALDGLIAAGHEMAAVYTQPPRRAGRGKKLTPSPVHQAAARHGLAVHTPTSLKTSDEQQAFAALKADLAVVVAYGLILPRAILDAPRHGCFNIHASLLPRWRGAAPLHRAIMAGDPETGITIMRMEVGLDTGPACLTARLPLTPATTTGQLHDELAPLGARLIVEALARLESGRLECQPQPDSGVTYARKIDKSEARIDWQQPAGQIRQHCHGLSPFPGAWFEIQAGERKPERIKILQAEVIARPAAADDDLPGRFVPDLKAITCGRDALHPVLVQKAGKQPMSFEALLRGLPPADSLIIR